MPTIDRLTFVFDADGSLAGEVKYWVGSLFGAQHCALCDLTHHRFGKRKAFDECAGRLGTPIDYLHRDELPSSLRSVAPALPAVIGHAGTESTLLIGPEELASLDGDLVAFEAMLTMKLAG